MSQLPTRLYLCEPRLKGGMKHAFHTHTRNKYTAVRQATLRNRTDAGHNWSGLLKTTLMKWTHTKGTDWQEQLCKCDFGTRFLVPLYLKDEHTLNCLPALHILGSLLALRTSITCLLAEEAKPLCTDNLPRSGESLRWPPIFTLPDIN